MEKKLYSVVFINNSKPYHFISDIDVKINDYVIVNTEKGEQFGQVVSENEAPSDISSYKEIIRLASEDDKNIYYKNLKDADSALKKSREIAKQLNLEMNIINAAFTFDRSQLLINFSADDRIDFRELARKLASVYRTRIELRQIGARDKAKQIGGVGVCGQQLCCTRFLNQIDSISMNKAKNQNLALNPSKINGACGRLLCCLCYEDEEYTRCSKGLLTQGSVVRINNEDATIISVDILSRTYTILLGDKKIKISDKELNHASKK